MNIEESLSYLFKKNEESVFKGAVVLEFFFFDHDKSSPFLDMMGRFEPFRWQKKLPIVSKEDTPLLVEAKKHVRQNPFLIALLDFFLACESGATSAFRKSLDACIDSYCDEEKEKHDDSREIGVGGNQPLLN